MQSFKENVAIDKENIRLDRENILLDGENIRLDGENIVLERENIMFDEENIGLKAELFINEEELYKAGTGEVNIRGVIYQSWVQNQKSVCVVCGTLAKTHQCKGNFYAQQGRKSQRRFKICLKCMYIDGTGIHICNDKGKYLHKMIMQTKDKDIIKDLQEVGMITSSQRVLSDIPYLIGMWELMCVGQKGVTNQDKQLLSKTINFKRRQKLEIFDEQRLTSNLFLPQTYFDICKLMGSLAAHKLNKKKIGIQDLFRFNWSGFQDFNMNIVDIFTSIGQVSELVWHLKRSHFEEFKKRRHLFLRNDIRNDARYLSEEEEKQIMKLEGLFSQSKEQIITIQDCLLQKREIKTYFLFKFFIAETMYVIVEKEQCQKIYKSFDVEDWVYQYPKTEQKTVSKIRFNEDKNELNSQEFGQVLSSRRMFLKQTKQKFQYWKKRVMTWRQYNTKVKEKNRYQFKYPSHVYSYLQKYHNFTRQRNIEAQQIRERKKYVDELCYLINTSHYCIGDNKTKAFEIIMTTYEYSQEQLLFLSETVKPVSIKQLQQILPDIDVERIYLQLCKKSQIQPSPQIIQLSDFFPIPIAKLSQHLFSEDFVPYKQNQVQSWAYRGCNQAFQMSQWFLKKTKMIQTIKNLKQIYKGFIDKEQIQQIKLKSKQFHLKNLTLQSYWWNQVGSVIQRQITAKWCMIDLSKKLIDSQRFAQMWERMRRKQLFQDFCKLYDEQQANYVCSPEINLQIVDKEFEIEWKKQNKIQGQMTSYKKKQDYNFYNERKKYREMKSEAIIQAKKKQYILNKLCHEQSIIDRIWAIQNQIDYSQCSYTDEQIEKIIFYLKSHNDLSLLLLFLTHEQIKRNAHQLKKLFQSDWSLIKKLEQKDIRLLPLIFSQKDRIQAFKNNIWTYGQQIRMFQFMLFQANIRNIKPDTRFKIIIMSNLKDIVDLNINHDYEQSWRCYYSNKEITKLFWLYEDIKQRYACLDLKLFYCFKSNNPMQMFRRIIKFHQSIVTSTYYQPPIPMLIHSSLIMHTIIRCRRIQFPEQIVLPPQQEPRTQQQPKIQHQQQQQIQQQPSQLQIPKLYLSQSALHPQLSQQIQQQYPQYQQPPQPQSALPSQLSQQIQQQPSQSVLHPQLSQQIQQYPQHQQPPQPQLQPQSALPSQLSPQIQQQYLQHQQPSQHQLVQQKLIQPAQLVQHSQSQIKIQQQLVQQRLIQPIKPMVQPQLVQFSQIQSQKIILSKPQQIQFQQLKQAKRVSIQKNAQMILNQYQDSIKQKQRQWLFDLQQIELRSNKRSSPINSQIKIKTSNLIFNLSTNQYINCPKKWDSEQFNIASLLKILTFVTTRKLLGDRQIQSVYPQMISSSIASKAGLVANKKYSLKNLFKGLIILSGCDAAITLQKIIANTLSKSLKQQMQKYASQRKWKFNVRDTSGLAFSTATQKCIVQLFIQALKDPLFSELIRQKSWNNKQNTNQLIDSGIYGKTGHWGKHNFIGYKKICHQQLIILTINNHQPEYTWISIRQDVQKLKQQILRISDIQLIHMDRPSKCSCGKKFNYNINSCTKCQIKLEKKVPQKVFSIGYFRQCQDIQIDDGGFKLANFNGGNNLKDRINFRFPNSKISQSLVYTGKLAGQIFLVDIPRVSDSDSQIINTTLENWEKLPLQIVTINSTIGQGIIATESIDKDVCLGSYTGQVYSIQQLPSDNNSIVDLGFINNFAFMVCPQKVLNYGRYFNGVKTQKPNLSVSRTLFKNRKGQLELGLICKTLKRITRGEEIKWKYGPKYWENM